MNTEQFDELRRLMVMEIASTTVMVGERIGKYNLDAGVLEVLGMVERH
jgi:hypothetical protein